MTSEIQNKIKHKLGYIFKHNNLEEMKKKNNIWQKYDTFLSHSDDSDSDYNTDYVANRFISIDEKSDKNNHIKLLILICFLIIIRHHHHHYGIFMMMKHYINFILNGMIIIVNRISL